MATDDSHSATGRGIVSHTSAAVAADQLLSATGRGIVSHTNAAVAADHSLSATGRRDTESYECCSGSRSVTQCNCEREMESY